LIHAAGLYESDGNLRGIFLGSSDRLSTIVSPPSKLPFVTPIILWLAGFFPVMAFVGPRIAHDVSAVKGI
jgi:hypothetical protein